MENQQVNPSMTPKSRVSFGLKILLLGFQCALLMIGALVIWIISESREENNRDVAREITQDWGGAVYVNGPVVEVKGDRTSCVYPSMFACEAVVETQSLHRNIYEAEVFNAHLVMSGTFSKDSVGSLGNTVNIELNVATKQITKLSPLKIGGKIVKWVKSDYSLSAKVDVSDMPQIIEFSTDFEIRGSGTINVKQIGDKSSVRISGAAPNPSFVGYSLPNERSIDADRFSAKWETDDSSTVINENDRGYVGTNFLVGVDRYQKVERSLKYAFIIIMLTYVSVLFTEIIIKRHIPLLNYFLIGAALIIYYTLLLSFSEQISFGLSYLVASAMTVVLIAGYMWKMLDSRKVAMLIGVLLTCIYICCYILLSLSTYALLLGSLILFMALAAMMYGSLRINH